MLKQSLDDRSNSSSLMNMLQACPHTNFSIIFSLPDLELAVDQRPQTTLS